jgi:hypothetical protein
LFEINLLKELCPASRNIAVSNLYKSRVPVSQSSLLHATTGSYSKIYISQFVCCWHSASSIKEAFCANTCSSAEDVQNQWLVELIIDDRYEKFRLGSFHVLFL